VAKSFLPGLILLAAMLPARADTTIDPKSWLTPDAPVGNINLPVQPVPGLVVPASQRPEAVRLLAETQIVQLEYEQARHLLGIDQNSILGVKGPAYLVRAVSPNSAGSCEASLRADILFVFCGSLGDWRYELRPIVVFLRQKPSIINVSAMTAK
jgi:hypothetical protein